MALACSSVQMGTRCCRGKRTASAGHEADAETCPPCVSTERGFFDLGGSLMAWRGADLSAADSRRRCRNRGSARRAVLAVVRLSRIISKDVPLVPGLLDGALRGAAGVLLIVPGFISDLVAMGLLVPKLRRRLIHYLSARLGGEPITPMVIEGDYRRVDDLGLSAPKRGPEDSDPDRTAEIHPSAGQTQGAKTRHSTR